MKYLKLKGKRLIGIIISQYPILVWKKTDTECTEKQNQKRLENSLMRVLSNGKKKLGEHLGSSNLYRSKK